MLLKEHCCEYNQGRQGIGTPAYHLMLLQRLAVIDGYAGPQSCLLYTSLTKHTATIRCITSCAYIRITNQKYIDELLADPIFGWINIQYLSSFINQVLTENDGLLLNNTRDKPVSYTHLDVYKRQDK